MNKQYSILLFCFFCSSFSIAQNTTGSYLFDGLQRDYVLHQPTNIDNSNTPRPLVLALHGLGDVASNFSNVGFNQIADTANFFVVYPQAVESFLGTAWNNGATSFGITLNGEVDDVGFLNSLIDTIATQHHIDLTRVYCTGFSMGSIMTNRIACELSNRLAAVAGVSGPMSDIDRNNCAATRAMPVLHIHGTADATVGYQEGNFNNFEAGLSGAAESVGFWATHNNCSDAIQVELLPDTANDGLTVEKQSFKPCDDGAEVLLYSVNEGQHTWLQSNNDINASVEIWNFFSRFQLDESVSVDANIATQDTDIQVFPNPFQSQLKVQSDDALIQGLRLINVLGQTVQTQTFTTPQHQLEWQIPNLPQGNYFLQVVFENNFIVKKITKE